jgi:hypothetical protein
MKNLVNAGKGPMPKRQPQNKRPLDEDETGAGEAANLVANAEILPNIKREFILTQLTDNTLQDAVRLFSRAIGTDLTNSHMLRVILKAVAHAMPVLEREVSQLGKLRRPSNARTSQLEREEFERKLASAVVAALRKSRPFEADARDRRQGKGSGKRSA